jgi:GDP-L-fucose synthase
VRSDVLALEGFLTVIDLSGKRVCVTGGAGFLGAAVVEKLRGRGGAEIFIPRRTDYDLVRQEAVERMYIPI